MNNNLLDTLETQDLDYKVQFEDSALKTISAFSNTEGGTLLIGIADDKTIIGVTLSNNDLASITNRIVDSIGITPSLKLIDDSNKKILKIEVQKSRVAIAFRGKYYKRIGNTTREMQGEELKEFFIKDTNWDSLTGNYHIDEIDENSIKTFIKFAIKSNRLGAFDEDDSIFNILQRLRLIIDNKITNAAIMLFGKDPQKYFINAVVRIGRFKDDITIISDKKIEGNLFNQIINAEEVIKSLINVKYDIKDSFQREDIWDYPLVAIREMLLNAVIHRDYFKHNIQTQIKIYDDYLWCSNPGGLPQGLTIAQLKTVHQSIPRNPLITEVFYRSGLVEVYGSGTQRMIKAFKDADLPEPEFKEEFAGFSVYLRKKSYTNVYTLEKLKETGLNERQIQAIIYLSNNEKITNKKYQKLNNTNNVTAFRDLDDLCKKGLINAHESGRNANYKLIITFIT